MISRHKDTEDVGSRKNSMKVKPQKTDSYSAEGDASSENIARRLKLDKGLGFLVRLLDTRVNVLYERLTAQNDITPRQFGVLLTLYQQGTLTLTELATHIRVDRSTLGEMINRMAERSLVSPSSRIGGFLSSPLIINQWLRSKGLHYSGWLG